MSLGFPLVAYFGKSHSQSFDLIYSAYSKGLLGALGCCSLALCEARTTEPVSEETKASDSSSKLISVQCRQASFSAFLGAAVWKLGDSGLGDREPLLK